MVSPLTFAYSQRAWFAREVLNTTQGHSKLLKLAEGQASDPERLARLQSSEDRHSEHEAVCRRDFSQPERRPRPTRITCGVLAVCAAKMLAVFR